MLQSTLKNYTKLSKCVKFGTKSTHFEIIFDYFFQSDLRSAILMHFEKFSKIKVCTACSNILFKNFKDNN